jgi:hypothetical protein
MKYEVNVRCGEPGWGTEQNILGQQIGEKEPGPE